MPDSSLLAALQAGLVSNEDAATTRMPDQMRQQFGPRLRGDVQGRTNAASGWMRKSGPGPIPDPVGIGTPTSL